MLLSTKVEQARIERAKNGMYSIMITIKSII